MDERLKDLQVTHYFCHGITAQDGVHPVTGNGIWSGLTPEEMEAKYPGTKVMTQGEFYEYQEKQLLSDPEEIDEEHYIEMLEVLPPQNWKMGKDQSFELCEHTSGRVTACFVRIDGKYYTFNGIAGEDHIAKVKAFLAKKGESDGKGKAS